MRWECSTVCMDMPEYGNWFDKQVEISYMVITHAIHSFRVLIPAVHKKSNVELHFYNDCFHNEYSGGNVAKIVFYL